MDASFGSLCLAQSTCGSEDTGEESRIQIKQVERGNTEGRNILARLTGEIGKMVEREWRCKQIEECIKNMETCYTATQVKSLIGRYSYTCDTKEEVGNTRH